MSAPHFFGLGLADPITAREAALWALALLTALTVPIITLGPKKVWSALTTNEAGTPDHSKAINSLTWSVVAWAVIFCTLRGTLSEWLVLGFAAIAAGGRAFGKWMGVRAARAGAPAAPKPPKTPKPPPAG